MTRSPRLLLVGLLVSACTKEPDLRVATTRELVTLVARTQKNDSHDSLGHRAGRELFDRPRAAVTSELIGLLREGAVDERSAAADLLGACLADSPMQASVRADVEAALRAVLEDGEDRVRASALYGLGRGCVDERPDEAPPGFTDAIQSLLVSKVAEARFKAAGAASWLGPAVASVAPLLVAGLKTESDSGARFMMAVALGTVGAGYAPAAGALIALLDDPEENVRLAAADSLGEFTRSGWPTVRRLLRCLMDASEAADVRIAAAHSLVKLAKNPDEAESVLQALLDHRAVFPEYREVDWLVALGKVAALVPKSAAGAAARTHVEARARSEDEYAARVATSSLARIACAVRDVPLGRRASVDLLEDLPRILERAQEERAGVDEYRPVMEALVELALWPEMQIEPGALRPVFEAVLRHRTRWDREWAGEQIARLK